MIWEKNSCRAFGGRELIGMRVLLLVLEGRFTALSYSADGKEQLVPGHAVVMQVMHTSMHADIDTNRIVTQIICLSGGAVRGAAVYIGRQTISRISFVW